MAETKKQPTCEERIDGHLASRLEDLRKLYDLYRDDPEAYDDDLGNLNEYGLDFCWVQPDDDEPGYFQWLLSTGGPHDEFRFYVDPGYRCHHVEYVFQDWFDGAELELTSNDRSFMVHLWIDFFQDFADHVYQKAQEA